MIVPKKQPGSRAASSGNAVLTIDAGVPSSASSPFYKHFRSENASIYSEPRLEVRFPIGRPSCTDLPSPDTRIAPPAQLAPVKFLVVIWWWLRVAGRRGGVDFIFPLTRRELVMFSSCRVNHCWRLSRRVASYKQRQSYGLVQM